MSSVDLKLSYQSQHSFLSICCSSNGEKISSINNTDNNGNGFIFNNTTNGVNDWYQNTSPTTSQKWYQVCSDASGHYLFSSNNYALYQSNDLNGNIYGSVWSKIPYTQIPFSYNGLCCSSSGKFVAFLTTNNITYTNTALNTPTWTSVSFDNQNLYYTSTLQCSKDGSVIAFLLSMDDQNQTFKLVVGYYNVNNYLFLHANELITGDLNNSSVCISGNGEYIHISTQGNDSTGYINGSLYTYHFINNIITLLFQPANPDQSLLWAWSAICCDSTGQYVAATLSSVNTNNSGIYISNDYGNSYQGFYTTTMYDWNHCCCDSKFKYLFLTNTTNENVCGIYKAVLNILPPAPTICMVQ